MITKFENFRIAVDTVELILASEIDENTIKKNIEDSILRVAPSNEKRDVLAHMSTLLLNAYLNRQELGISAIDRSTIARRIISNIIQNY